MGIGQCNTVIQSLTGEGNQTSEEIGNRCLGEAYFLRAHYYYILVRLFGGVPLILEPHEADDNTDSERATLDACYDRIIKDCGQAVSLLPEKRSYTGSDYNRASRDAALCMLADILLTYHPEQNYAEVVNICGQIEDMGYDLSIVSRGLGHESLKTTQIYLSTIDTSAVANANRRMIGRIIR